MKHVCRACGAKFDGSLPCLCPECGAMQEEGRLTRFLRDFLDELGKEPDDDEQEDLDEDLDDL